MKDDKDIKDDLLVEIDESQLALPMEKKDDDLVIETPEEKKPEPVKAETEKRERKRHNQDAIDALKAQLDEANRRNAEAEQRRREAEERAAAREAELEKARGQVAQSEYDRVQGYIAAATAKEDNIKRALKSAHEVGDYDKVTELQGQLAEVAARKIQYSDAKVRMERDAERAEKELAPKVERTEQRETRDPFEARISGLSHKSQAWLREHPECVTDEAQNAKVIWADKDARKKGIQPDSPEYFSHIEKLMGFADTDDDGDDDEIEVETPKSDSRRAMPAAPVSREARSGQVAPGKYRLTREEAEIAEQLGMTPTEYAKSKLMAIKNGRYDNA